MVLTIGSGDIAFLMMGNNTKGYQDLLRRFVADDRPYWNSFASPIDALRTGAILEFNYLNHLPENYIFQKKSVCKNMDVFVSSIDFAAIENGQIVDFDELKTIYFPDFLDLIVPNKDSDEDIYLPMIKSKFKKNYEQIQCQLMCSDLDSANLVFLSVKSYVDEENKLREITENDYVKFRIKRDDEVISKIKKKGKFFQNIKDHFSDKPKPKKEKAKQTVKTEEKIISEPTPEEKEETPEIEQKAEPNPLIENLLNSEIDI